MPLSASISVRLWLQATRKLETLAIAQLLRQIVRGLLTSCPETRCCCGQFESMVCRGIVPPNWLLVDIDRTATDITIKLSKC